MNARLTSSTTASRDRRCRQLHPKASGARRPGLVRVTLRPGRFGVALAGTPRSGLRSPPFSAHTAQRSPARLDTGVPVGLASASRFVTCRVRTIASQVRSLPLTLRVIGFTAVRSRPLLPRRRVPPSGPRGFRLSGSVPLLFGLRGSGLSGNMPLPSGPRCSRFCAAALAAAPPGATSLFLARCLAASVLLLGHGSASSTNSLVQRLLEDAVVALLNDFLAAFLHTAPETAEEKLIRVIWVADW